MKGYKALNMDMSSAYCDMVYKIGKKYTITGELIICINGFHFCKHLEDVENYYEIVKSRIFEVEAEGKIIDGGNKSCAESITLIRELSKEEIHQYFVDNQERILEKYYPCQKALADQGLCLDKLINNENWYVREAVAKQGYGLNILVNDKNYCVRAAVAKQGYDLETLIHDKDPWVRVAVAKQDYGLDILVNDKNWRVREEAAAQGYSLDILIKDEDPDVRKAVAVQGYGLNVLIEDESPTVRKEVARQGYGLETLIHDLNGYVREVAYAKLETLQ